MKRKKLKKKYFKNLSPISSVKKIKAGAKKKMVFY